jgi:hypothetical protein
MAGHVPTLTQAPGRTPIVQGKTGYVSDTWLIFFNRLVEQLGVANFIAVTVDPASPVENQIWLFSDELTPATLYLKWHHGGTTDAFPLATHS